MIGQSVLRFSPLAGQPLPRIKRLPQILVHKVDRNLDDFVVLASDGLWDYVTNAEAVEIVRAAAYEDGDPESSSDRLVQVNVFISSLN